MKKIIFSFFAIAGLTLISCDAKKEAKTTVGNTETKEKEVSNKLDDKAKDIQQKLDEANAELNQLLKEI